MKIALMSGVIAIALIVGGYFYGRSDGRELERKDALESAMKNVQKIREEDKQILEEQGRMANETKKQLDKALADFRAADNASDKLQQRIASLTERLKHSASSSNCETTRITGILLANMLSRIDKRAGELAEYADRSRIAGLACEGQYDALNIEK